MSDKEEKKLNEKERTYAGCYGQQVSYEQLSKFLNMSFQMNAISEKQGTERFASCIWGHSGCGKTSLVKQYRNIPVEWNGKSYKGYDVRDVPIAQFEEMGDLHGIPMDCILMRNNGDSQWVPQREQTILAFKELGWKLDTKSPPRTIMAPPDWVPLEPGPSILLLDDWNRASIRIIKGIMQLLQNYGMVSWKLPPGCNIVLTGNPDEQEYLVTTIDSAILTRIKHVTLKEDAKEWSVWATSQGLDARGISWVLYQPEMMIGAERTNPRTLAAFFKELVNINNIEAQREDFLLHANSLLDEETVNAFFVFCTRHMEEVIEPLDILDGKIEVEKSIDKLMKRKEPRTDILGVICQRLFATLIDEKIEQTKERINNFQNFITSDSIPEDMRDSVCRQLAKKMDASGRNHKWIMDNKKLRKQVMDMLHTN